MLSPPPFKVPQLYCRHTLPLNHIRPLCDRTWFSSLSVNLLFRYSSVIIPSSRLASLTASAASLE